MHHIDWGLGAFQSSAFDPYPPDRPLDLATVYQDLLAAGQLAAYEVPNRFYEIGSAAGIEDTDVHLRRKAQRQRP
jgi:NDP-sugar pyrophosphorylase family protein